MRRRTSAGSRTMSKPATAALPDVGGSRVVSILMRGALAGAVRSDQAEDLSVGGCDRDGIHRCHVAELLGQLVGLQRGCGGMIARSHGLPSRRE